MRKTPIQVAKVTKALRALMVQLDWSAFQAFSSGDQNLVLNQLLNAGLIEDLRTTMDHLSRFLWSYVNAAAQAPSGSELDYQAQSKHLEKIAEMLRVLHRPASPAEDPLAFVERVTRSVDRHLETASNNAGKPAASPSPQAAEPERHEERDSEASDGEDTVVSIRVPRFGSGPNGGGRLGPISWR